VESIYLLRIFVKLFCARDSARSLLLHAESSEPRASGARRGQKPGTRTRLERWPGTVDHLT
jgi:hypothetical protein